MILDGTSGLTTPGVVNTAGETIATTLAVTGASTLTGAVTASTTLAVTGVSTFAAGTALLPALTTTGDTNTGLWFPAADTVAASTGGTERMRIDASGNLLVISAAALGYGTGSGGTVTQATSRATSVTINKPTGAITLFAALGSATPAKFSVSNSVVAATDTIIVSVKSSTNIYRAYITAVAAAGFDIAFESVSGVASDSPVFNFAIIRGATS